MKIHVVGPFGMRSGVAGTTAAWVHGFRAAGADVMLVTNTSPTSNIHDPLLEGVDIVQAYDRGDNAARWPDPPLLGRTPVQKAEIASWNDLTSRDFDQALLAELRRRHGS
jgi:hypothetical protein